jgi:hypothetical protein
MDKREIARRQLGAALDMFLRGQDPVSIHTLAMAGGEIAERLAKTAGVEPFINHVLDTFPDISMQDARNIQRKYSNAFKHATDKNGLDREDEAILQSFGADVNDHVLFIGWYDFGRSGSPRPIEAQVFEAWYLAKYPEKINPTESARITKIFPNLPTTSPQRQHQILLKTIRKARKNGFVMKDPGTEPRPLLLPWDPATT